MATSKNLDPEAVREDHARGLTVTQLATKYGVRHSTIAYHLKGHRDGAEAPVSIEAIDGNRHATRLDTDPLDALLNTRWKCLPLLEKVRLLLDYRPPTASGPGAA